MKKLIPLILSLMVLAVAVFGILQAHRVYGSWWLNIYLAVFVAVPLLAAVQGVTTGPQGFKNLFRSLLSVSAGLLIMTLVHQHLTESWFWACLAGAAIPSTVLAALQWQTSMAQVKLSQAAQATEAQEYGQALKLAQDARTVFAAKGKRDGQAAAEWHIALAYANAGELVRAARYANSTLTLSRALGQEKQAEQAERLLAQLRMRGIDTTASAVGEEALEDVASVDWGFILSGALGIAFVLTLLRLWGAKVAQVSPVVLVAFGLVLFLFVYGNYTIAALANTSLREKRTLWRPVLVFNLALLLLVVGSMSLVLNRSFLQVSDFPSGVQRLMYHLTDLEAAWPTWLLPVVVLVCVVLMVGAIVVGSGRSPVRLLNAATGGGAKRKALQLAQGHLDAQQWGEAIDQLARIDLAREKNVALRKEVLFCKAFAHHMVGHPAEARQYTRELLELDAQHREALYLAGFLALDRDLLDEAEINWRKLYSVDPKFSPSGDTNRSVEYYLCLTLYRKSMSAMKESVDTGAEILAEVSKIGALDKEVSDALVRVHLYRVAQSFRQRKWEQADSEVQLALTKLEHLEHLVQDRTELAKLKGLCRAAQGLIMFRQDKHDGAVESFASALEETKDLARKGDLFGQAGRSFLEQLLRAAAELKDRDESRIDSSFGRDLYYLASLAQVRMLHSDLSIGSLSGERKAQAESVLSSKVKSGLEKSINQDPSFDQARALLGLLYYYLSDDKAVREKGIEILQTVCERVGSKFVAQTVKAQKEEKQRHEDARKAYFDLLQQYLQSSSVPRGDREGLRKRVLEDMQAAGEYEVFVGQGSLEIESDRERETTVQEYVNRAALLREKLNQLSQLDRKGQLPEEVQALMNTLGTHNQQLQKLVQEISQTEQQLLLKAQGIL